MARTDAWFHLVAHAADRLHPLESAPVAWYLWLRLRAAFPHVLAACLLPTHVHLLIQATIDAVTARLRLAQVLGSVSRRLHHPRLWQPVPNVEPLPDARHALRTLRYIHLNPCRDGLVTDPLVWPWSTHRGVIGAEFDPWVQLDALRALVARARGRDLTRAERQSFAHWLHQYVSADPACAVDGTPFPIAERANAVPRVTLAEVLSAAAAATPWSGPHARGNRRHAAVLLAHHQGWIHSADIARALSITPQMVCRWRARLDPRLLAPAALCLGDSRLRSNAFYGFDRSTSVTRRRA